MLRPAGELIGAQRLGGALIAIRKSVPLHTIGRKRRRDREAHIVQGVMNRPQDLRQIAAAIRDGAGAGVLPCYLSCYLAGMSG